MKPKTARRFIQRGRWKRAKRRLAYSQRKLLKKAYRVLAKDSRNPASQRILIRDYTLGRR